MKHFLKQSINYPNWWYNYRIPFYRLKFKENPVYKLYYWTFKERFDLESRIYLKENDEVHPYQKFHKERLAKRYYGIPFHKRLFALLFYLL